MSKNYAKLGIEVHKKMHGKISVQEMNERHKYHVLVVESNVKKILLGEKAKKFMEE